MNNIDEKKIEQSKWFYGLIGLLILYACFTHSQHIDIVEALQGFSGVEWVYKFYHPTEFINDFPGGFENYDKSSFMYLYKLLYYVHGIPLEYHAVVILFLGVLLLTAGYIYLTKTLIKDASPTILFLVIALGMLSSATDINLSRFGSATYYALYYPAADGLGLIAIAFWLRKQFIFSALALTAAITTHPIIGFYNAAFIIAAQLINFRIFFNKKVIASFILLLISSLLWFGLHFDKTNLVGSKIPNGMWFALTNFTSVHWYPVSIGVFSAMFAKPFYSFLAFLTLLIYCMSRTFDETGYLKMMVFGILGTGILVLIGLLCSILKPDPFFIKLALQRSNNIIVYVGLIYIVNYLWVEFKTASAWRRSVILTTFLTPFFAVVPYTLLNSWLVSAPVWRQAVMQKFFSRWDILLGALLLLMSLLAIVYYLLGYGEGFGGYGELTYFPAPYTGGKFIIEILIVSFPLFYLLKFFSSRFDLGYLFAIVIVVIACIFWSHKPVLTPEEIKLGKAYKKVQIWAQQNTPANSLFMTDPTICYGWRAYSQRSTFGNVINWLSVWLYDSNYQTYMAGLQRFKEFGLDLNFYLNKDNTVMKSYSKMWLDFQNRYYEMPDQWFSYMTKKYGINYFVMEKVKIQHPPKLPIVFENKAFVVFKADL